MVSDDAIISMAGLGAFMAGYAGVSITAQTLQAAVSVADKAGKGFLTLLNRTPIEMTLDRLGIGMIPNPSPAKSISNNNWWLERKTGLGTQDIGALGLGLVAAAAIMWEMRHPYVMKAVDTYADLQTVTANNLKSLLEKLGPEAQAKLIESLPIPDLRKLIAAK